MKLSKNKAFAGVMSLVMAGSSFLPGVRAEDDLKTKAINFVKYWTPAASLGLTAIGTTAGIASLIFCALNTISKDKKTEDLKELVGKLKNEIGNNKDYTENIEKLRKQIEEFGKNLPKKFEVGDFESIFIEWIRSRVLNDCLETLWNEFATKKLDSKKKRVNVRNNSNSNERFLAGCIVNVIKDCHIGNFEDNGSGLCLLLLNIKDGKKPEEVWFNSNFNSEDGYKLIAKKVENLRIVFGKDFIKEVFKRFFVEKMNELAKEIQDKKLAEEKEKKEKEEQEKQKKLKEETGNEQKETTTTEGTENEEKK